MAEEEPPKDAATATAAAAPAAVAPAAVVVDPILEIEPGNLALALALQDDGLHVRGSKPNLHGL